MKNKNKGDRFARILSIVALVSVIVLVIMGTFGGDIGRLINRGVGKLTHGAPTSSNEHVAATSAEPGKTVTVAGVIRNTGDGWKLIEDNRHAPLNCTGVSVNEAKGSIRIDYSEIDAKKVVSFTITPDETLSSLGYICGASVGTDHADVYVYKSNSGLIIERDPNNIVSSSGNLWFMGIFETE